jgi:hypothetical protein
MKKIILFIAILPAMAFAQWTSDAVPVIYTERPAFNIYFFMPPPEQPRAGDYRANRHEREPKPELYYYFTRQEYNPQIDPSGVHIYDLPGFSRNPDFGHGRIRVKLQGNFLVRKKWWEK